MSGKLTVRVWGCLFLCEVVVFVPVKSSVHACEVVFILIRLFVPVRLSVVPVRLSVHVNEVACS